MDGGDLVVDGTRIAAVGAPGELSGEEVDRTIDTTGALVLPGLVNTHQHDWYIYGKGLGGNMLLEKWISDCLFPLKSHITVDDLRLASELASLDMLRGGTTTSVNHQVNETTLSVEEAILQPVAETGIRQYFGKVIRPSDVATGYEGAQESFERWDGYANGHVRVGFVLEATAHWVQVGTCTPEMVLGGQKLAVAKDTFVTSHIAGGTMSETVGYLKFVNAMGRTDLQFLHQLGVLDDRWILAHTINPMGNDLDLIAESGSTVAHTPSSEAARGGGITPVKHMLGNGVRVAIGTDGPMVDLTNDMVEQLKWTRLLQNQVTLDPDSIPLEKIIAMGTEDGAHAVRAGDLFGSLEVGKAADIAVFDLATLHASPVYRPLSTFVHAARGRDAKHVMVDGEMLVENGKFTRVNDLYVTDLLRQAGERGKALARRAGLITSD
ncbi:amidohydrolase family protein [Kibdelosporangium philippinense]|uniref:Amidohydrolase family protein n=1 Tax=Kibdelosporangium philippinense TaxID=211113 RepID=A0ABS8ZU22_9PSEU|nr:amidohydrolase family protein [Kibdelosporangium philippinense]MCE7011094.1 amidohydrolase family protein [Kibdelosporangium philippinense]